MSPWVVDDEGRRVPVKKMAPQMRLSDLKKWAEDCLLTLSRYHGTGSADPLLGFWGPDGSVPLYFVNGRREESGVWVLSLDGDPWYEDDSDDEGEEGG